MLHFCVRVLLSILLLNTSFLVAANSLSGENYARGENKNMLGVFLGGTDTKNSNFFTYGFEYHHVINPPLGISLIAENTPSNLEGNNEVELVGLFTLNIFKNAIVGVGPGAQFEQGKSTTYMARISAGYIFLFSNNIELTPGIDYNFVHQEPNNFIYGVTLGKQF